MPVRIVQSKQNARLKELRRALAHYYANSGRGDPIVIGIGTGRTMRAVGDQLPQMECPQHRLVGLVGTTKIDGSASFYDVIIRVSDTVRAPHYPMPLPVVARSVEERDLLVIDVASDFDRPYHDCLVLQLKVI